MDARPAPIGGLANDDRELVREIDQLTASDAPSDLERALRLAADALRGRPNPQLVLVGDGAWDASILNRIKLNAQKPDLSSIDLTGIDLRYVPVGKSADNVGITAFAVPGDAPGLEPGAPESKLGLRSSLTAASVETEGRAPERREEANGRFAGRGDVAGRIAAKPGDIRESR